MEQQSPITDALQTIRKRLNPKIETDPQGISQAAQQQFQSYQQTAPTQNMQAVISQAAAQLKPDSNSKQVQVGKVLNTPDYSNMCLQYVDDMTGNKDRMPMAYADYQRNLNAGNIQTKGTPPKGARIYFAPTPDNPAGHVMLSNGDGTGTGSTTSQGIKTFKISDWERYASQQFIGWSK